MAFQAANANPAYIQHTVAGGDPNADPLLTPASFPSGTLLLDQTLGVLWILRRSAGVAAWVSTAAGSSPPSGPAGGDLGGTYPNPTVTNMHLLEEISGNIAFYNGSNWRALLGAQFLVQASTTANNTPVQVASLTLLDNSAYAVKALVTARDTTGAGNRAAYEITCSAYRAGGGATLQGQANLATIESAAGWDCVFDVSGNDLIVKATGDAVQLVGWRTLLIATAV